MSAEQTKNITCDELMVLLVKQQNEIKEMKEMINKQNEIIKQQNERIDKNRLLIDDNRVSIEENRDSIGCVMGFIEEARESNGSYWGY